VKSEDLDRKKEMAGPGLHSSSGLPINKSKSVMSNGRGNGSWELGDPSSFCTRPELIDKLAT